MISFPPALYLLLAPVTGLRVLCLLQTHTIMKCNSCPALPLARSGNLHSSISAFRAIRGYYYYNWFTPYTQIILSSPTKSCTIAPPAMCFQGGPLGAPQTGLRHHTGGGRWSRLSISTQIASCCRQHQHQQRSVWWLPFCRDQEARRHPRWAA